ncbi:MAG: RNA-directed DNA polymerase (Reverse transcriptase) [Candidatus Moranbacteria bacterium GW2011_GWA2_39_41]|nr:MAG: RNA-directed DNA polymerase (Reverse transcriptase) [Candidatus Moranbacteria bacterium GW2011_GWA2_39_41]
MYDKLISLENIFLAWKEFKKNKQNKRDVQIFERFLEDNIFSLHEELKNKIYKHAAYKTFNINDPKPRKISKATVKDRLVHHLIFKKLYSIFDAGFIFHSYSSRIGKGSYLAIGKLDEYLRKESRNNTKTVYVLKCDIRKFFQNISHKKLLQLIACKISNKYFLWLIVEIINSFGTSVDNFPQRERERVTRKIFWKKWLATWQCHFANFCQYIPQ